jgi:hypothetical protein
MDINSKFLQKHSASYNLLGKDFNISMGLLESSDKLSYITMITYAPTSMRNIGYIGFGIIQIFTSILSNLTIVILQSKELIGANTMNPLQSR